MAELSEASPVLKDEQTGTRHPLHRRIETVGSARECTIRIDDLAPFAAQILFEGGTYQLQEITPGVRIEIDGRRLKKKAAPKNGDRIKIDKKTFTFLQQGETGGEENDESPGDPIFGFIGVMVSLLQDRNRDVSQGLVTSVSKLLRCDAARLVIESNEDGRRKTVA
ncbi:MAG: hypothetical protein GF344_00670, partial [Chitinivibrionales bacterium]|nr:hypothetical protein [Chitinivibrionales bacterium]MBD3355634.1 hypothetical protein [Chitinivibrionales bacterium]